MEIVVVVLVIALLLKLIFSVIGLLVRLALIVFLIAFLSGLAHHHGFDRRFFHEDFGGPAVSQPGRLYPQAVPYQTGPRRY